MAYVIKKPGTKLSTQAGSSFGGMTKAAVDVDTFYKPDGGWSPDKFEAVKYPTEDAAQTIANTLPQSPSFRYEILEE